VRDGLAAQELPSDNLERLSDREMQVALLIAEGLPDKAITHVLGIRYGTVRTHVNRIFKKLAVDSRCGVAARIWSSPTSNAPQVRQAQQDVASSEGPVHRLPVVTS
jgi:DNA-binding NarL/FixJ family response regulator